MAQVKDLVPPRMPSTSDTSWKSQVVAYTLDLLANKLGVPTTSSPGLIICYNVSQNSQKYFTFYYWFITKGTTQEQPNGRCVWQGMGEGVQSFPLFSGHITLLASLHSSIWKLSKSHYVGFLWRFHYRHDWLYLQPLVINFFSLSSLLEVGWWGVGLKIPTF